MLNSRSSSRWENEELRRAQQVDLALSSNLADESNAFIDLQVPGQRLEAFLGFSRSCDQKVVRRLIDHRVGAKENVKALARFQRTHAQHVRSGMIEFITPGKLRQINSVGNKVNLRGIDAQLVDGLAEKRALDDDRIDAIERSSQPLLNSRIGADTPAR